MLMMQMMMMQMMVMMMTMATMMTIVGMINPLRLGSFSKVGMITSTPFDFLHCYYIAHFIDHGVLRGCYSDAIHIWDGDSR